MTANHDNGASSVEVLYTEIRKRISLLHYPPGMALSENILAKEFGVSRTPIRRILQRLEFEGLVTTKRGIGTIVTTIDLKSLKAVYAFRMKLHEITGGLCPVVRVSEEEMAALVDMRQQSGRLRDAYDPKALARLYNSFQELMLSFISNDPLRRVSEIYYFQTARLWLQILPDLSWPEEVDYITEEIDQVIEALRMGDMGAVGQVRRRHLVMNLNRMWGGESL
jgi:DNA-binding GntR family transcriptional regulator